MQIFRSIYTILSEKPEDNWKNPIFHKDSETPKPSVEYYPQTAINGKLPAIDDIVCEDYWKE